jgi:hypothetical protein
MQELKDKFDIILIETSSISEQDRAKEWLQFTDRVTAVYEAGKTINDTKKEGVAYLASLGKNFIGWVLNKAAV